MLRPTGEGARGGPRGIRNSVGAFSGQTGMDSSLRRAVSVVEFEFGTEFIQCHKQPTSIVYAAKLNFNAFIGSVMIPNDEDMPRG